MAKRVVSGIEKRIKKPIIRRIRRKKKSLLKKIVDYLKSDSYMFAPLVSHYPSDFLASNVTVSSSTAGVENRKGKNKSLVEKVGNYLNSDSYLYAPLLARRPLPSSIGIIRMEVSETKLVRKGNERIVEEKNNVTVEKVSMGGEKVIRKQ
ncbi:uncharacterized protein [Euphorbia lathyris]|uniref:uncharacterized protein n=1 Tax=Euphorbia lathyris TaxID=212925 RepID=UPI003314073E